MKNHTSVIAVFLIGVQAVLADGIIPTPAEQRLYDKLTSLQTSPVKNDVIEAFRSSNTEVRLEALKWLVLHREFRLWRELNQQVDPVKGTCVPLSSILEYLAAHPPSDDVPLALFLKAEHIGQMSPIGKPRPPRYKDLDAPIGEVLYEVLAKDLNRPTISLVRRREAAGVLLRYHAPSKQLENAVLEQAKRAASEPSK